MPGAGPEHALGLARPGTGHTRRRAPRLHCETSGRGEYRQFTRVQPLGQVETNHCVLGLGSAGWRSFCFLTIIVWGPKGGSWGPPEPQSWGTPQSCSYREPVGGRARGQQGAALGRPLAAPSPGRWAWGGVPWRKPPTFSLLLAVQGASRTTKPLDGALASSWTGGFTWTCSTSLSATSASCGRGGGGRCQSAVGMLSEHPRAHPFPAPGARCTWHAREPPWAAPRDPGTHVFLL